MVWEYKKRLQKGRWSSDSQTTADQKSKKAQEAIKAVASKVNSNLLRSSQIHEKDGQAPQCVPPYHVNHSQIRPWTYPFQNKVVSTF